MRTLLQYEHCRAAHESHRCAHSSLRPQNFVIATSLRCTLVSGHSWTTNTMRAVLTIRRATARAVKRCMATTPRTLQQLVEHAEDPDLIKAAQRAHVELSDRVEEQVARCTALEATAPTNRDLGTLTALYKGVATELAAGDEIAAAARASDADIAALHRSFKSIEERHSSFVPSVVDALREGNVPVSAASLLEDLLAAHIGASTVLRNHLLRAVVWGRPTREARREARGARRRAHGTGAARLDAKLINVVGAAVGDAQLVCEHAYDLADPPPVSIADDGSAAACVPAHATHVVRELLKNALVATIEKHVAKHGPNSDAWDEELPPVEIAVAASTISVVDHGGGLEDPDALLRIRPDLSSRYDRLDERAARVLQLDSQKPISTCARCPCVEIKFRVRRVLDRCCPRGAWTCMLWWLTKVSHCSHCTHRSVKFFTVTDAAR